MRSQRSSILMVNVVGGAVACALLAAGAWHAFLRPSAASAELRDLRSELADRTQDLATLEHELGKQKALAEQRETRLVTAGAPPTQAPIEDNLRTISDLARRNDVHLREVAPLGAVSYPGAHELRYRVRGAGRFADLANMLSRFEECDFWGDIAYLEIARAPGAPDPGTANRELNLTISFYSAVDGAEASADAR